MKWVRIDVGKGTVDVNDNITEGDLNSSGILVEGFPESWKGKMVNAVFYKGKESVDVILELNADKDRFTGTIPAQMLAEDGSFKVVIYAVSADQVDEPYKDVRPAVWAEVKDGIDTAELLPLDKDVGAYLTLLIDLQNKEASIDEMIARLGDIEAIKAKLDSVADGAEVNVQADWAETDPKSDAFIPNKPNLKEMEERLREEISLARDVAHNAGSSADANKEALEQHRANGDEDVKHLTDAEKADVGTIGNITLNLTNLTSSVEMVRSELANAKTDISDIKTEADAVKSGVESNAREIAAARSDIAILDTEKIDREELQDALYPPTVTDVPTTLAVNTAYNFGSQPNITLAFPTVANDGDVIYVGFVSRETTNLVVDTTNTFDFELIPEVNTGYEIYAKCTTSLTDPMWIVKYSEYSGVGE